MGFFSKFEGRMEDTFEGAADKMFDAPISPVQIAKKAEKMMRREKMVGAGKQFAPTLYTVLVNPDDDQRLFGYYPTLAGETETYLAAKAANEGLMMDGQPLVRFIVDEDLRHGKFDIIAEPVAAPIIAQLRAEEMHRYGLGAAPSPGRGGMPGYQQAPQPQQSQQPYGGDFGTPGGDPFAPRPMPGQMPGQMPAQPLGQQQQYAQADPYGQGFGEPQNRAPLPYVPEDELDYSIDYGEYTFDSQDFDDYSANGVASRPISQGNGQGAQSAYAAPEQSYDQGGYDQGGYNAPEQGNARDAYPAPEQDYNQGGYGGLGEYGDHRGYDGHAAPSAPFDEFAGSNAGIMGDAAGAGFAGGVGAAGAGFAGAAGAGFGGAAAGAAGMHAAQGDYNAGAPDTVVFAAGSGNAAPMPNAHAVRARLINMNDDRAYDLASARFVLGRDRSADIVVDDINASRTHAELRFEPQGVWVVTDLGSTNGTYVNGVEITSQPLQGGDRITIGMTNYAFSLS